MSNLYRELLEEQKKVLIALGKKEKELSRLFVGCSVSKEPIEAEIALLQKQLDVLKRATDHVYRTSWHPLSKSQLPEKNGYYWVLDLPTEEERDNLEGIVEIPNEFREILGIPDDYKDPFVQVKQAFYFKELEAFETNHCIAWMRIPPIQEEEPSE